MSSLGSQWRVIRHYLSLTNLNTEVEKLVQKIKPATPEQWENLLTKFEKVVSARISQSVEIEKDNAKEINAPKVKTTAPTVEEAEKAKPMAASAASELPATTDRLQEKPVESMQADLGSESREISLEGIWQGLKLRKDLHFGNISEPSWKNTKPLITKSSIHSRTAHVIAALAAASSAECALVRAERLVEHLLLHPEARDYAVKEGGVRALLRLQARRDCGAELRGVAREALALLGHGAALKGRGPNVLALDGGGIRGLAALRVLQHLERATGRRAHELFDYIIGVSTGAIIAAVIGRRGSLETASEMYHTLSKKMFGGTSVIGGTSRLVWSHSYYDTEAWERMLQEQLGDTTLTQCNRLEAPALALVSCVVAGGAFSPFVFRSYAAAFRTRPAFPGTAKAKLWHAVRASAAAPTYFDEFRLDGLLHQDGGVMVNNPAGVGLHEARLLFGPDALAHGCVVSVGTGRLPRHARADAPAPANSSWRDKFNKILDSATDTEGVHQVLNDLLPADTYFRFNPPLVQPCAMDEVAPERLAALATAADEYVRRNRHKLERAAARLLRPRPRLLRLKDALRRRALLLGLTGPE